MSKMFRKVLMSAVVLSSVAFVSCDKNEPDNTLTVDMVYSQFEYNESGVWKECLNPDMGDVTCQNVQFSHQGIASEYGNYWFGFCPSRSQDMADYSDGNWLEHQWNVMSGGGVSGVGTPYLVACWNTMDSMDDPEASSLRITYNNGNTNFTPESVCVNNSSYSYYVMKNGSAFSAKFASGDWFKVQFYGYSASGEVVGPVDCYLADYRSENESEWVMVKDWQVVDLSALGKEGSLKYMFIRMDSSDSGMWGMNTPGYFCLDQLKIAFE